MTAAGMAACGPAHAMFKQWVCGCCRAVEVAGTCDGRCWCCSVTHCCSLITRAHQGHTQWVWQVPRGPRGEEQGAPGGGGRYMATISYVASATLLLRLSCLCCTDWQRGLQGHVHVCGCFMATHVYRWLAQGLWQVRLAARRGRGLAAASGCFLGSCLSQAGSLTTPGALPHKVGSCL